MPANVTVLATVAGSDELACRLYAEYDFRQRNQQVRHGVISYYAARALQRATTAAHWLRLVNQAVASDVHSGRLPAMFRPELQVLGDPNAPLLGGAKA